MCLFLWPGYKIRRLNMPLVDLTTRLFMKYRTCLWSLEKLTSSTIMCDLQQFLLGQICYLGCYKTPFMVLQMSVSTPCVQGERGRFERNLSPEGRQMTRLHGTLAYKAPGKSGASSGLHSCWSNTMYIPVFNGLTLKGTVASRTVKNGFSFFGEQNLLTILQLLRHGVEFCAI